jgi:photosynthetic reaction center cytochrome c subunit
MKPQTLASIALLSIICGLVVALEGNEHVSAQQTRTAEQAFKNIKVIKTMPADRLQGAMFFISASLGVDCTYCHTPPAMEKDDKPAKETARRMLLMVSEINKNFGDKNVVNCATCHRGKTSPVVVPMTLSLNTPLTSKNTTVTQQPLPTVDEILDRYWKAIGGMRAFEKITTRARKGSVEVGGVKGTFEFYEVAPNKALLIGTVPAPVGPVLQAFDGSNGWVKNQNGVFDMRGEGLEQARREWLFYGDVKLKEQFREMSVAGRERVDGREFYVVQATRSDGPSERLYFDVATGLLVRRYYETPSYFGKLANTTDYDDYRKVGAVRLPFVIRKARGGTVLLQTIAEYKLNPAIDEAKFKKPAPEK